MNEEVQQVAESETATPSESTFDWKSAIPEEVKGNKVFDNHKDLGSLLKSHAHQQAMIGAEKIPLPGSNATEEHWNEVYTRLGKPSDVDGYKLDVTMPEGQQADEGLLSWFKQTSLKAGLNNSQAQAMLNEYQKVAQSQGQVDSGKIEQIKTEGIETLQREYGAAFDDKVKIGNAAITQFQATDLTQLQLADGRMLGDHPDFVRAFVGVGDFIRGKIGEDSLEGVKTTNAMTPAIAQQKINEIKRQGGPFWNSKDPEHSWAVAEALRLQEFITPDE
tara:strand:+ start:1783 stop:2610 length:828 start_codon:yes stop_codon:yes gene_type:complete